MIAPYRSQLAIDQSLILALKTVKEEKGLRGLFAGVVPRTLWISIGGFVFFGVYEKMKIVATSSISSNAGWIICTKKYKRIYQ